jgi:hypothetical protein
LWTMCNLSGPDEDVFLPGPDQAFDEQEKKDQHGDARGEGEAGEGDGEGEQEDSFDVEDEKDDGVEIVAGLELNPGVALGFEAALIDGVFAGTGLVRRELCRPEPGEKERREREAKGRDEKHQNR